MRMRPVSLAVTVVLLALGLSDGARAVLYAQQPATPRRPAGPGGQGGTIGGGVSGQPSPAPRPGQRPVRDPRAPAVEGTATIKGRVIDAATGAAIPRAKVRHMGNRDSRNTRIVTTDAEGGFTLTKVQAGPVVLSVEKPTYLQGMYPERRRSMRGSAIQLAEGQTIDNLTIALYRGGAISGRLSDAYGDPVEGVMLHAIPVSQKASATPFRNFQRSSQSTNDIGEFRISRLEPGQYYLLAMPTRRGGPNEEDPASAVGRTFYPGATSMEQAQPITIERGQTMAGLDFQLLETTLTRVTGFVLNSKGNPATRGYISVRTAGAIKGLPQGGMGNMGGSGIQNGTFELTLQPGDYIIEAMASGDDVPSMNSNEMDRGELRLAVGGESISGVTISTGRGGTVSGRFVFKGTSAPPTNLQGFNVGFTGPNGGVGDECRAFNRSTVNPDGTFSAENMWGTCQIRGGGMTKGWTFEAVMHNGNDITSRVVELGAGRSISGVEIVYSDRVGDVAVTVTDDRGTPTQDYVAIAFPVEKEKWGDQRFMRFQVKSASSNPGGGTAGAGMPGGDGSRVTPTMSLVQGGPYAGMVNSTFSGPSVMSGSGNNFTTLLAGDYFAVALDDAAPEDLRDVEYLERLSQIATRVSVSAGGQEAVQLRRVPPPQN